jgi:hypothetical protein
MVRDTLDGKPKQQIEAVDDEGRPLSIALVTFDSLQAGENKTVDNEIVH